MEGVHPIEQARNEGNDLFKSNDFKAAVHAYSTAIDAAQPFKQGEQFNLSPTLIEALAAAYANRAECYLRLKDFDHVKLDCEAALMLKPAYSKALFRKAKALFAQGSLQEAMVDITRCIQIDPKNNSAKDTALAIRAAIAMEAERNSNPTVLIQNVRDAMAENDDEKLCQNIRLVLKRYDDSMTLQIQTVQLAFPEILLDLILDTTRSAAVRIQSLRAVVALFSTEFDETKKALSQTFLELEEKCGKLVDVALEAFERDLAENDATNLRKGFHLSLSCLGTEKQV
jgi:tetratricopeptide (TPR) repeat protein